MKKIIIILSIIVSITILYAAVEDFETYTEIDPDNDITITSTRVTCTNVYSRILDSYVYKDYGVDYFSGDFTHYLTISSASGGDACFDFWAMANAINDELGLRNAHEDHLAITWYQDTFFVLEEVEADIYTDSYSSGSSFTLYLTIKRDESIGDYGIFYCLIYSDAERTTKVDSIGLMLHEKEDFRYLYVFNNYNDGDYTQWTGYTENLEFYESLRRNIIVVN